MAEPRQRSPRVSREVRLLILTIVVSGAVLLLLARLRFPAPPPAVDASSAPLQRLAARASFEELAQRVSRLEAEVLPNLVVLRLDAAGHPAPVRLGDLLRAPHAPRREPGHVPAIRLDAVTALAALPPDASVAGVVGDTPPAGTVRVLATDTVRGVVRLAVPEGPSRPLPQVPLASLRTPAYVVAVEGTRAGLTLRPVFLGRSERFRSPRWRQPLLPLGGATVALGALMFTLDGEFLGCAVLDDGTLAIADAGDFVAQAGAPDGDRVARVEPGFSAQAITPAMARALGAGQGVVVAAVDEAGPSAGRLEPGDVITQVDGVPVGTPEALLLDVSAMLAAGPVSLTVVRASESTTVSLDQASSAPPGLEGTQVSPPNLQLVRGVGALVASLDGGSPLAQAGLQAGDVVVRLGTTRAPTPAQVRAAIDRATAEPVVLVFRRAGRQVVAVLDRTGSTGDVPH